MNEEYTAASGAARRNMLGTVRDTDKKIADIYNRAAQDLARAASAAKPESLTARWASDYQRELDSRVRQLNGQVESTITDAAGRAASQAANATVSWLDQVLANTRGTSGGASFASVLSRTPDEALRAVVSGQAYLDGKSLSQRIWSANGRLQGGINEILSQGIAQKKSAFQLAKDLERFVNPDAREDFDWTKVYPDLPAWLKNGWKSVEKSAQRLARTSINHSYHIAMKEAAARNPFATAIHWALSPQHYERQILPFGADICDEYAIHNEGLGRGNWPIKDVPLPHANCLCSQYAVVPESLDECAKQLGAWLNGQPNPKFDAAFGEWKRELSGEEIDRGVRYDAAQERVTLIEQAAALRGIDSMDVEARERLFAELENLSLEELRRRIASGL